MNTAAAMVKTSHFLRVGLTPLSPAAKLGSAFDVHHGWTLSETFWCNGLRGHAASSAVRRF